MALSRNWCVKFKVLNYILKKLETRSGCTERHPAKAVISSEEEGFKGSPEEWFKEM